MLKRTETRNFVRIGKRDRRYFELSDGELFLPVGMNLCFPRFELDEEKVFADYRRCMKLFAENGGNFIRIWLSHPFFELEPERIGIIDPVRLNRLSRLIELAGEFNIRLKLTLEHFRTLEDVPQVERNPGVPSFGKPQLSQKNGGPAESLLDFLNGSASRKAFLDKLDSLAARFSDEPTIMAWELWNEMNNLGYDNPGFTAWTSWTDFMLEEVRNRFPNHLVLQSCGSFAWMDLYNCYRYLAQSRCDYLQIHNYYDPGAELDFCQAPMDVLASKSILILNELNPATPLILAEAGAVEWKHMRISHFLESDQKGMLLHDILFAPFFSGSAGCGQCWHWEFYIERHHLWHHYGRFAEAIKGIDPLEEDFTVFQRESKRLRFYVLDGKKHQLVWCRDKRNTIETELVQEVAPERLHETVDLRNLSGGAFSALEAYLPWENRHVVLQPEGTRITLPEFERSIVLRLTRSL